MTEVVLHEYKKNETVKVKMILSEFAGHQGINIREYYLSNGNWLPGRQGIWISIKHLEDLAEGISQAYLHLYDEAANT